MPRCFFVVIAFVGVMLLACGGAGTKQGTTQASDILAWPEQIDTPADHCKAYLADKGKAESTYRGRQVQWRLTVGTNASRTPDKELFVVFDTGTKEFIVVGLFDDQQEKAVRALQKGDKVHVQGTIGDVTVGKLRGKVTGEVWMTLDRCTLLNGE